MSRPSIKSYLVQAIWNWCTDVGLTPYVLVRVDDNCVVPQEFVEDGQINVPIAESSTVVKAARDALNGWDPTGGAIYYFNPDTATNSWIWSRPLIKTIGKHRFCK